MEEKLEYEDFKDLFGTWAPRFKKFIEGKEMYNIYQRLKADSQKEVICPDSADTFRSFLESNYQNIKTVWYLMDPYPKRYKNRKMQAVGVPMDCRNSPDGKLQPSLVKFYEGISKELGKEVEKSANLQYLLDQGVLLLNTELTVKLNKTGSHEGLWEPFQKYFLEEVMREKTGIVYVLSGKASHKMERYINPLGNHIFKIDHPSFAARTSQDWNTKGVFTKTNKILHDNNGSWIEWNKADYLTLAPF